MDLDQSLCFFLVRSSGVTFSDLHSHCGQTLPCWHGVQAVCLVQRALDWAVGWGLPLSQPGARPSMVLRFLLCGERPLRGHVGCEAHDVRHWRQCTLTGKWVLF